MKGSAFGFFRDKSLRRQGALDLQKNPYSRQQFGGTIGGPVAKDRTHYFAAFEQVVEDSIVAFRPGGAYASRAADLPFPFNQSLLSGGVDHQITAHQTLRARVVYEHARQENFRAGGVGDLSSGMNLNRNNFNAHGDAFRDCSAAARSISSQCSTGGGSSPNRTTRRPSPNISRAATRCRRAPISSAIRTTRTTPSKCATPSSSALGSGRWAQDLKVGGSVQYVRDAWNFPVYPHNLLIYLNDTRDIPLIYVGTSGPTDDTVTTTLISGFAQTQLRPAANLSVTLGARYDLDTDGNNPDYTSPQMPTARGRDTNNVQPRAGLSWDVAGQRPPCGPRRRRASSPAASCSCRHISSACRTGSPG